LEYHNNFEKLPQIKIFSQEKLNNLNAICRDFPFKANDYYLNLINWDDPEDPIKRIIFPCEEESQHWGKYDASNEASITVNKGVQHKYPYTVLLLCNEECGGYCRYCFRKRVFMRENNEVSLDVKKGIKYISKNPQVTNVLLTGGDPLLLPNYKLVEILSEIRKIDHVGIIRIGSKLPAFNPMRIYEDYELLDILKEFSTPEKRIYLMTHFDHPGELTKEAQKKQLSKNVYPSKNIQVSKVKNQSKIEEPDEFSIPTPKINPLASGTGSSYGANGDTSPSSSITTSGEGTEGENTQGSSRRRGSGFGKDTTGNMLNTYDISPYVNELQRSIRWNWKPPKGQENKRVELFLRIARDGKLVILNIKKTSLSGEVDNAATDAVKKTLPLNPLPAKYKKSYLDVVFILDYNASSIRSKY